MPSLTRVIGNKNYPSWSMRPWLLLRPVVLRFQTYGVALEGAARDYTDAVLALPALQAWVAEAERIEKFDLYE